MSAAAARTRALRDWEQSHPGIDYDRNVFHREMVPRLKAVKLANNMDLAGISQGFASDVRRGEIRAACVTWPALAALVGASTRSLPGCCALRSRRTPPATHPSESNYQLRLGCLEDTGDRIVEDCVELLVGLVN